MISTANNIEAVFYNVTQLVIICSLFVETIYVTTQ